MAIDNTVTIIGNATREPELRFTPTGNAVTSFGVAVNRRWQNKQTMEWEEQTSFIDVTCWNELAENVAESIGRGCRVTVVGRLDQRSWETDGGDKRSKVEIVADDVSPSLRWATAMVTKTERKNGANSAGQQHQNSGGNQQRHGQQQPNDGGRGQQGGGQNQQQGAPGRYSADEEPF